jgi:hypothetical protein
MWYGTTPVDYEGYGLTILALLGLLVLVRRPLAPVVAVRRPDLAGRSGVFRAGSRAGRWLARLDKPPAEPSVEEWGPGGPTATEEPDAASVNGGSADPSPGGADGDHADGDQADIDRTDGDHANGGHLPPPTERQLQWAHTNPWASTPQLEPEAVPEAEAEAVPEAPLEVAEPTARAGEPQAEPGEPEAEPGEPT